jgi:vitamin B12 transporter
MRYVKKIETNITQISLFLVILLNSISLFAQIDTLSGRKYEIPGEVEIIGQRTPSVWSELARKITIISKDEIVSSSAITVQDLLEYVSSVDIRQRNINGVQADIQIRGGTADEVMILLNGVNITDSQTGHFNLDIPLDLSSVERIEIVNGSGARIYGANAYKGVINIITRKNLSQLSAGINLGQNNLFGGYASADLKSGKLYNGITFSHNSSDGFTKNTDYKINNIYYQGELNNSAANLFWQAGINRKAFGANDFYSPSFPDQYEENGSRFGSIEIRTKGKIKITGVGYLRSHNDHFLLKRNIPAFYENFHLTHNYGIRVNASFNSTLGKTSMGIEDRKESIESTSLGNNLSSSVKISRTDSAYYTKGYSRTTYSYFMEHNLSLNNIYITGGFLLNHNKDFRNKIEIFPGIDFSYKLFENKGKIFGSINRSLRQPTFTDLFYKDPSNEGNPSLKPEEITSIETGFEYLDNVKSLAVTIFRDHCKQVIDWVWIPSDGIYKAMNISEVTTRGIEINWKYHFKNTGYNFLYFENIGSSYTFIDLEKASGDYISKYSLDYLKHKLQIFVTYNFFKQIKFNWQISYSSRNGSYIDYDASTNTRFESPFKPYWLVDAKAYFKNKSADIFVSATNLFNTKYTDIGNLIQPGRWVTAGIKVNIIKEKL